MTEILQAGIERRVGRKKLWAERLLITLAEGTTARVDAVVGQGEDRLAVIREAIEAEVLRRERLAKRTKSQN